MTNKRALFLSGINVNEKNNIQMLINKLKCGEMKAENLTEKQRKEVCILMRNEISRKEEELMKKKNKILFNKIKKTDNKDDILKRISYEDKKNFIEYLNAINRKV